MLSIAKWSREGVQYLSHLCLPGGFWTPGWTVKDRKRLYKWKAEMRSGQTNSVRLYCFYSTFHHLVCIRDCCWKLLGKFNFSRQVCTKVALCNSSGTQTDEFDIFPSTVCHKMNGTIINRIIDDVQREVWLNTNVLTVNFTFCATKIIQNKTVSNCEFLNIYLGKRTNDFHTWKHKNGFALISKCHSEALLIQNKSQNTHSNVYQICRARRESEFVFILNI